MDKKRSAEERRQKSHSMMLDFFAKVAGKSFQKVFNDMFLKDEYMKMRQYSYSVGIEDDPIAAFVIQRLDTERALINMREYENMIAATDRAVRREVEKSVEGALDDIAKRFR